MSTPIQQTPQHPPETPQRSGSATVLPLWEEHVARWAGPRQLQVQIPIIGWFTAPPFAYRVGTTLGRRWAARMLEEQPVESVVGNCEERPARRVLTLLITFADVPTAERRLDGLQMARDLRAAVHEAAAQDRAGRTPPVTVDLGPRLG